MEEGATVQVLATNPASDTLQCRVKCITLHPKYSWMMNAKFNGDVEIIDNNEGTAVKCLLTLRAHDTPVRAAAFHPRLAVFVTAGDDCVIKLWSYYSRSAADSSSDSCSSSAAASADAHLTLTATFIGRLLGHIDYVRSLQFHHTHEWVLSASDDQTIRIWDWKSRRLITVFTGHEHYVMNAVFHPTKNLVLSASLDRTVRIWDTSQLMAQPIRPSGFGAIVTGLFSSATTTCVAVLEGHKKGVNHVTVSPFDTSLIASCADDYTVRVWNLDTKATLHVFNGHKQNVSCGVFVDDGVLVTCGEDARLIAWDLKALRWLFIDVRERCWTVAIDQNERLFIGHDTGITTLKLSPGWSNSPNSVATAHAVDLFATRAGLPAAGTTQTALCTPQGKDACLFLFAGAGVMVTAAAIVAIGFYFMGKYFALGLVLAVGSFCGWRWCLNRLEYRRHQDEITQEEDMAARKPYAFDPY